MGIPHRVTVLDETNDDMAARIAAAGPLRGVLFGLIFGTLGFVTGHPTLLSSALTIVIINLIAFLPLRHTDGGTLWKHQALLTQAA